MTTIRNSALVAELSTDLLPRNDALNRMAGHVSAHMNIPGLRGLYAMSSIQVGATTDQSGTTRILTNNGTPQFGFTNLIPYVNLVSASSQYLSRADEGGLDILGTEAYVETAANGLSMGGWVNLTALSGGTQRGIMSKWNATGNQRSYMLQLSATDQIGFFVSTDGIAPVGVTHTNTISTGEWMHIVVRFTPSTELAIWINGTKVTNTVGVPASIFNSTAAFEIGRMNANNANCGDFYGSMMWLSTMAISDAWAFSLFEQGRAIFDV